MNIGSITFYFSQIIEVKLFGIYSLLRTFIYIYIYICVYRIVLINALLIPFQVAVSSRFETLNTIQFAIMSFLLFMDIIFSFYISYYDNEFTLIIERNKVYKHYLRTWFIPDLCSFLPCMYLFFNIASKTKWIISLILYLLILYLPLYKLVY